MTFKIDLNGLPDREEATPHTQIIDLSGLPDDPISDAFHQVQDIDPDHAAKVYGQDRKSVV